MVTHMQIRRSYKRNDILVLGRYYGTVRTKLDYWYCYNCTSKEIEVIEETQLRSFKLKASACAIKDQKFLDELSLKLFEHGRH